MYGSVSISWNSYWETLNMKCFRNKKVKFRVNDDVSDQRQKVELLNRLQALVFQVRFESESYDSSTIILERMLVIMMHV